MLAALVGLTSTVGCGAFSVGVVCATAGGGALAAAQTETLVTPSRLAVGCGRSVVAQLVELGAGGLGCGGGGLGGGCAWGVVLGLELDVVVVVTCTPGLAVGMVTTSGALVSTGGGCIGGGCIGGGFIGGSGLDLGGQTALTMPPSRIAASSEFGGAGAFEQELMTFAATASSAISHIGEQPPWKSAGAHDGIWA